jgi:hypothetical protein
MAALKKSYQCEGPHTPFDQTASFIEHLADAKVSVTWRTIMPGTDLLKQSATRAELDQRSRDARLRLEHVERLLVVRPLPRQSLLRRVLRCLRSRTRFGGQIAGRSMTAVPAGTRMPGEQKIRAESDGVASGFPSPPGAGWNYPRTVRMSRRRPNAAMPPRGPAPYGFKAWDHWCGRGDLNSHVLSDNRF